MADEFDIYGDDTFGQPDDILDEIVNESTRETKRRRTTPANADDDLFDDFGDIVKDVKPVIKTQKSVAVHQSTVAIKTEEQSYSSPGDDTERHDMTPQKIRSSVPGYSTQRNTAEPTRRGDPPAALNSLRGLTMQPTNGLYIGDLAWYTTDENIKAPLLQAGLGGELKDLTFFEHKVNGKSKGIVFLEFTNPESASRAKTVLDNAEFNGKRAVTCFTTAPNPFKHLPKEPVKNTRTQPMNRTNNNSPSNSSNSLPHHGMAGFSGNFGFNAGFGNTPMGIPPYGYSPMVANYMGSPGGFPSGNRGRGGMQQARGNQTSNNYMNRMSRGGGSGGGGGINGGINGGGGGGGYMNDAAGFHGGGMYINPAFFDQQQQQGGGGY